MLSDFAKYYAFLLVDIDGQELQQNTKTKLEPANENLNIGAQKATQGSAHVDIHDERPSKTFMTSVEPRIFAFAKHRFKIGNELYLNRK